MVPIVWITLAKDTKPLLPGLSKSDFTRIDPIHPKGFTKREAKKYLSSATSGVKGGKNVESEDYLKLFREYYWKVTY